MKDRIVIVSGFGAFRDYLHDDDNPSTPLARSVAAELNARNIACECIAPVAVAWGEVERVVASALARHRGASISWVALGAGRDFAIESQATNRRATNLPDVGGMMARNQVSILNDVGDDPDAIQVIPWSMESLTLLQASLATRGFSVRLSSDAGGYICNSVAYAIYKSQRSGSVARSMFIHTPSALGAEDRIAFAHALVEALFFGGERFC